MQFDPTRLDIKMTLILAWGCPQTLSGSNRCGSCMSQFKVFIINILIVVKYSILTKRLTDDFQ